MNRTIFKDIFREIRKTFGRFMSILGIVLVGVAFFVGVKASAPYMTQSADAYFDRMDFFDLKLFSTVGFDEDDIKELENTEGVLEVDAGFKIDAVTHIDDNEHAIQLMSYDSEKEINKLIVTSGRLPEKEGECVMRDYKMKNFGLEVGDKIVLESGTDTDIKDILSVDTYTIVGFVKTPYYLSYQYEASTVGNGNTDTVLFLPKSDYVPEVSNVVYLTVNNAKEEHTYEDSYFDVVDPVRERVEELGEKLCDDKYKDMCDKAMLVYGDDSMVPECKWYVLDRNSHFSYVDYENCADRMDNIAKVFPVFFYLVAALVCLTTMTRMVDEQRGNIGTMKALGYSSFAISSKYVIYAILASALGGVIGCFVGLKVFPSVIFNAWNIVYTVDGLTKAPQTLLCIIAVVIAVFVTVLATIFACISEIVETPALLLRPKAPKSGKKIILERIGFLWKRFSFSQKVTARNILRYKKRFFMTIVGIAGCTALILAGFGIKNSVAMVAIGQYEDIFDYDISGELPKEVDLDDFWEKYSKDSRVKSMMYVRRDSATAARDRSGDSAKEKNASVIAVADTEKYLGFTSLYRNSDKKEIEIPKDGVLITYKLAKDFSLGKGDILTLKIGSDYYEAEVSDIVNMYVGQYVFMSDSTYEKVFSKDYEINEFILNTVSESDELQESIGSEMIQEYNISGVSYYDRIKHNFDSIIASLDIITVVLIVSAALLAFVVLYNLTNVNISERIREVATIKVLGFYDTEVASYVYRENIILSIIGSAAGLLLGILLHGYIMDVIEMDDVIFPKMIAGLSYLFAFIITVAFGLIVNLVMYRKLCKIPMVESLKSVE